MQLRNSASLFFEGFWPTSNFQNVLMLGASSKTLISDLKSNIKSRFGFSKIRFFISAYIKNMILSVEHITTKLPKLPAHNFSRLLEIDFKLRFKFEQCNCIFEESKWDNYSVTNSGS